MAKRFTDTNIWDDQWFRELQPRLKEFWRYLYERCDGAGVWKMDFGTASHFIGEQVTEKDLEAFGTKVMRIAPKKLWITEFISFQYKTLKPKNKAHRGIMKAIVEQVGVLPLEGETLDLVESFKLILAEPNAKVIKPSIDSQLTLDRQPIGTQLTSQEKEKEEDKEKLKEEEKKKEGGAGEVSQDQLAAESDWVETLRHFGIERPILPHERTKIFSLIKGYDAKSVRYALTGMRFQVKTETFDPGKHVSIARVMDPKNFETFTNLAAAEVTKQKKKQESAQAKRVMEEISWGSQ